MRGAHFSIPYATLRHDLEQRLRQVAEAHAARSNAVRSGQMELFADNPAKKHGLSFREALGTVARGDRELLGIAAAAPVLMSALAGEDET